MVKSAVLNLRQISPVAGDFAQKAAYRNILTLKRYSQLTKKDKNNDVPTKRKAHEATQGRIQSNFCILTT